MTTTPAADSPSGAEPGELTRISKVFVVKVMCSRSSKFCYDVEKAVLVAAEKLEQVFVFFSKINVLVVFSEKMKDPTSVIAFTHSTPMQVRHVDEDVVYTYPSALLKQLRADNEDVIRWPEYDMKLNITNVEEIWYMQDEHTSINGNQYDLVALALHEILHGMGFGQESVLRKVQNVTTSGSKILIPEKTSVEHKYFLPTIWNRFTFLNNVPSLEHLRQFQSCIDGTKPADCIKEKGLRMYKAATTHKTLEFRTGAWPAVYKPNPPRTVVLDTSFDEFEEGKSAAHIGEIPSQISGFPQTPDFLMYSGRKNGKTLETMCRETDAPTSGIGPNILEIMLALGYCPWVGQCQPRNITIHALDELSSGASGTTRAAKTVRQALNPSYTGATMPKPYPPLQTKETLNPVKTARPANDSRPAPLVALIAGLVAALLIASVALIVFWRKRTKARSTRRPTAALDIPRKYRDSYTSTSS